MTVRDLAKRALQLPARQRARLAKRLLRSLDEGREPDVLDAWVQEAERRYRAYRQGKTTSRPAVEALRDLWRQLR
ncbi:MAG TPA: addiction module protein [Phycisphaerae bacterium]|nr:addiction module protein [Phycisphaerae bacterium]